MNVANHELDENGYYVWHTWEWVLWIGLGTVMLTVLVIMVSVLAYALDNR